MRAGRFMPVFSASWAQAEFTGETELPLSPAGRPDSSQGMWAGDKTDDVGVLFTCVQCMQSSRQKVGFINQQLSEINALG